jgi:hypothetical protein
MKAQEYLRQLKKLDKLIENKLAERDQWFAITTAVTQRLSADRVQTSSNPHKMEDAVLKLMEVEKELDAAIDAFVDAKREIIATVTKLSETNETYYDVLHKIYVQYCTLDEVADLYKNSRSWVNQTHGRALGFVQRIIDEKEREKNVS